MGRSQETNKKKEVRSKKEKKKKEKAKRREERKDHKKGNSLDDMIAYVNEDGSLSDTPPDQEEKEETNPEDIEISVPKGAPQEEADPIHKGTVTFYNESKGFGFIRDSENGQSIFFHVSGLMEEVSEGNAVNFEIIQGKKGPNANNVKVIRG